MKRSNLMFLVIGVAIIFSGCSKDNSLAPDLSQSDQGTSCLKAEKIPHSGISQPVVGGFFDPGIWDTLPNGNIKIKGLMAEWYDTADTPLLTGTSMWYENALYNPYDPKLKFWGSVELAVEGGEGVWQGSWHGYGTFSGPTPYHFFGSPLVGEIELVFTGHGGDIQGMVAKSTWNIDSSVAFEYSFAGTYH
ncbi:MAG: hypothetical protein K8R74_04790 [Bacteroidales bacterium]|nr:hypothetical protein [Bacteroidales bacterium]